MRQEPVDDIIAKGISDILDRHLQRLYDPEDDDDERERLRRQQLLPFLVHDDPAIAFQASHWLARSLGVSADPDEYHEFYRQCAVVDRAAVFSVFSLCAEQYGQMLRGVDLFELAFSTAESCKDTRIRSAALRLLGVRNYEKHFFWPLVTDSKHRILSLTQRLMRSPCTEIRQAAIYTWETFVCANSGSITRDDLGHLLQQMESPAACIDERQQILSVVSLVVPLWLFDHNGSADSEQPELKLLDVFAMTVSSIRLILDDLIVAPHQCCDRNLTSAVEDLTNDFCRHSDLFGPDEHSVRAMLVEILDRLYEKRCMCDRESCRTDLMFQGLARSNSLKLLDPGKYASRPYASIDPRFYNPTRLIRWINS